MSTLSDICEIGWTHKVSDDMLCDWAIDSQYWDQPKSVLLSGKAHFKLISLCEQGLEVSFEPLREVKGVWP